MLAKAQKPALDPEALVPFWTRLQRKTLIRMDEYAVKIRRESGKKPTSQKIVNEALDEYLRKRGA